MDKRLISIYIMIVMLATLLTGCYDRKSPAPVTAYHPLPVAIESPIPIQVTVSGNVNLATPIPVTGNVTVAGTVGISGNVTVDQPVRVTTTGTDVVSINQDVVPDPLNSSTANLASGATFTGTGVSTLGVNAVQVSLATDRDSIVYVDQSPDNSNWDITDTYTFYSGLGGQSWTVQAVQSYYRVRVKNNNGAITTYFRLQSVLCPVVEALPRSLNEDGRLKTDATLTDEYGNSAEITLNNELRVVSPVKLAGAPFIGNTVDSNFWQTSVSNNGSVTQSGGLLSVSTNTTANGAAHISSVRRARYIAGSSMRYRSSLMVTAGATNNVRRWGVADWATMPTITDGAWFQFSGNTTEVVTMKSGSATTVSSGSFNGVYGTTYNLDTSDHIFEIYWNTSIVQFVIDSEVVHTVRASSGPWTATPTLYIWMDSVNSGGATSTNRIDARVASIDRLGQIQSATTYKHITTATTTVCKLGAGNLHSIMVNTPTNSTVTIYDNTAASGNVIAIIALGNNTIPLALPFNIDFYTGLTIVTSGSPDLSIIFE